MAGSTFGKLFRITTWGESHGKGIGVVVDGVPSGLPLEEADIQAYLDRRKPGQSKYTTARKEADKVQILSGIFEGKTTGTPVSMMVSNTDQHSKDYSALAGLYRPGHADFSFDQKYGFRDYRGGGRSSGRETIGRVAGGALAAMVLKKLGITFTTYTKSIGPVCSSEENFDPAFIMENDLYMADRDAYEKASAYLDQCRQEKDSSGGIAECRIYGVPAGLGDPVFDKLDAELAKAIFSIGAVKGFEIGDGFEASRKKGSQNNDPFVPAGSTIATKTNHCGGILGGISSGGPIVFRAAFKPTPSIARPQQTVAQDGNPTEIEIKGRHDPIIVPRAIVVVECMAAVVLLNALMENMPARMDHIEKFYF